MPNGNTHTNRDNNSLRSVLGAKEIYCSGGVTRVSTIEGGFRKQCVLLLNPNISFAIQHSDKRRAASEPYEVTQKIDFPTEQE